MSQVLSKYGEQGASHIRKGLQRRMRFRIFAAVHGVPGLVAKLQQDLYVL